MLSDLPSPTGLSWQSALKGTVHVSQWTYLTSLLWGEHGGLSLNVTSQRAWVAEGTLLNAALPLPSGATWAGGLPFSASKVDTVPQEL